MKIPFETYLLHPPQKFTHGTCDTNGKIETIFNSDSRASQLNLRDSGMNFAPLEKLFGELLSTGVISEETLSLMSGFKHLHHIIIGEKTFEIAK